MILIIIYLFVMSIAIEVVLDYVSNKYLAIAIKIGTLLALAIGFVYALHVGIYG